MRLGKENGVEGGQNTKRCIYVYTTRPTGGWSGESALFMVDQHTLAMRKVASTKAARCLSSSVRLAVGLDASHTKARIRDNVLKPAAPDTSMALM